MKNLAVILFCLVASSALAQGPSASFVDFQRTLQRPSGALKKKEDTLKRQFATKGLQWPAKYLYIRSFKYDAKFAHFEKLNKCLIFQ